MRFSIPIVCVVFALLICDGVNGNVRPEQLRIDCHPEPGCTRGRCLARKCLFDPNTSGKYDGAPWCYYPPTVGYVHSGSYDPSQAVQDIMLAREKTSTGSPFGGDIDELNMTVVTLSGSNIQVMIRPRTGTKRFEPPLSLRLPKDRFVPKEPGMDIEFGIAKDAESGVSHWRIVRKSNKRVLFDTSIGGFIYSDQFLQISTYLPSYALYGFGENIHQTLKHDLSMYKTWPLWARDQPTWAETETRANHYGVHPFYLVVEPDGRSHGVLFYNANAQEYTTGPAPSFTYRTIGGILQMFFFPGPTALDVIRQYQAAIGKPLLPSFWSLGAQLCRYGYKNTSEVRDVVRRMREAKIPYDTQYIDVDYMNRSKIFSLGEGFQDMPDFVNELHGFGMRNIILVDPAPEADSPPFVRAMEKDIFMEWETMDMVPETNNQYESTKGKQAMLAVVWPDYNVAFPDFFLTKTKEWWADEVKRFHDRVPFDGMWIDMNEPAVFGTNDPSPWYFGTDHLNTTQLMCPEDGNKWDHPPYETWAVYHWQEDAPLEHPPIAKLHSKTMCLSAMQMNGAMRHYDMHNLYGLSMAMATMPAVQKATGKRSVTICRSTFPTSGRYVGHWLGDNYATWADLKVSIIGMIEFNMFGIPYVGADICGFNGDTNEELCLRWHQLGSFYPFSRNHNGKAEISQEPYLWPSVAAATKKANEFRYMYLPTLYSLHYDASLNGGVVVQPLFFEFPNDRTTLDIDAQFMWGKSLLISPAVYKGQSMVNAYFPDADWYDISSESVDGYGMKVPISGWVMLSAGKTERVPVHLRGGHIVVRQRSAMTTKESMETPFTIVIGYDSKTEMSMGTLYWDTGESMDSVGNSVPIVHHKLMLMFDGRNNTLSITAENPNGEAIPLPLLEEIEVIGYPMRQSPSAIQSSTPAAATGVKTSVQRSDQLTVMRIRWPVPLNLHSIYQMPGRRLQISWT